MRSIFKYERSYKSYLKEYKKRLSKGWSVGTKPYTREQFAKEYENSVLDSRALKVAGVRKSPKDIILDEQFSTKYKRGVLKNRLHGIVEGLKVGEYEDRIGDDPLAIEVGQRLIDLENANVNYKNYHQINDVVAMFFSLVPNIEEVLSPKEYELA